MNPFAKVDAELRPWVEANPTIVVDTTNLQMLRDRRLTRPDPEALALPIDVRICALPAAGGAPELAALLFVPRGLGAPAPAILHIHGGGFVRGSASENENGLRRLAAKLGCSVLSVDYRLAPEAPFPAALDDCYTALAWLFEYGATHGIDTRCIGVMGESAGGGLAACLALMARDRGEYPLAFQHLHYPALDDRSCTAMLPPHMGRIIWTVESHRFAWRCYLGREPGGNGISPYAAAARARDLAGLPPTFIGVGELDLLAPENIDFAGRLVAAGVQTEFHLLPGAFHGFDRVAASQIGAHFGELAFQALRRVMDRSLA